MIVSGSKKERAAKIQMYLDFYKTTVDYYISADYNDLASHTKWGLKAIDPLYLLVNSIISPLHQYSLEEGYNATRDKIAQATLESDIDMDLNCFISDCKDFVDCELDPETEESLLRYLT